MHGCTEWLGVMISSGYSQQCVCIEANQHSNIGDVSGGMSATLLCWRPAGLT
jgi:hypothetical protein